jgi:hypothetical protein
MVMCWEPKSLNMSWVKWTGHFRSSPAKWRPSDGEAVVQAVFNAGINPVDRPVDERKLKYRPKALKAKIGSVTVPESDENETSNQVLEGKKPTEHTDYRKIRGGFGVWKLK